MFVLKTLLQLNMKFVFQRSYTLLYEQQFTVVPFCNINVKLPFNVAIVPLDVHKYTNHDKVVVSLLSDTKKSPVELKCNHDNENIDISSSEEAPNLTCSIEAPIKANINITTCTGNINVSNFNGEQISLLSESGNIAASKCHCNKITIRSSNGNITCASVIQAAEIYLETGENGSIKTGRLQGLVLKASTENGAINTESSYCNDSTFKTKNGQLELHSTHKDCKVSIRENGLLSMTGFDGTLQAVLSDGVADVQLSRIQGDSQIKIEGGGALKLKLAEACVKDTAFKIISKSLHISDDIKLNSDSDAKPIVLIDCRQSNVTIQSASWMEMFNIKPSM